MKSTRCCDCQDAITHTHCINQLWRKNDAVIAIVAITVYRATPWHQSCILISGERRDQSGESYITLRWMPLYKRQGNYWRGVWHLNSIIPVSFSVGICEDRYTLSLDYMYHQIPPDPWSLISLLRSSWIQHLFCLLVCVSTYSNRNLATLLVNLLVPKSPSTTPAPAVPE